MAKKRMYSRKRNSKRGYSRKTIKKSRRSKRQNTRKLNRHKKLRGGSGTTVIELSGDESFQDLRKMVYPHREALQGIINTIFRRCLGRNDRSEASEHREVIEHIIESKRQLMLAATENDADYARHRKDLEGLQQLVHWQLRPFN